METSRLKRDGTAEPVLRDQILRHVRGQGNIHFLPSADHEQDWQPYPVDSHSATSVYVMAVRTHIHTFIISPHWGEANTSSLEITTTTVPDGAVTNIQLNTHNQQSLIPSLGETHERLNLYVGNHAIRISQ